MPEIVSVDGAARALGLSRTTIFKFLREGKLARYRIVGRWWTGTKWLSL